MFCHKINRLIRSKENQLLTSMRGDLLIACHALMGILVKEIVVLGTHDGGAKGRSKKGKTNVSGALLGKVLNHSQSVSIHSQHTGF
jgi:hypothetical protein